MESRRFTQKYWEIPIEYLGKASSWLKEKGYEKIGLYGVSKGAEYALAAASILSEFSCVIAVSPLDYVVEGLTSKSRLTNTSSWSYQGKGLPYVPLKMKILRLLWKCIKEKQVNMGFLYEEALKHAKEEAAIRVENIQGSVLFISAKDDCIWPSDMASNRIMKRLKKNNFSFPYNHLSYTYASHLIIPLRIGKEKYFLSEKNYPNECDECRSDSFRKTLQWLKDNW